MSMTAMPTIACQRGHRKHHTKTVRVDLSKPHAYGDLAPVPARLAPPPFDFVVWDPEKHPVDGGAYCPAHDAVSATIAECGIWEPSETILTLAVCQTPGLVLDFGCQIGWFTVLAALSGCAVRAYDADEENLNVLTRNTAIVNKAWEVTPYHLRVGYQTPSLPPLAVRLAKLDVEGAEPDVIRMLSASINQHRVDHLCIEVTPKWAPQMRHLLGWVMDAGYEAFLMPPKHTPPYPWAQFPLDIEWRRLESAGLTAEMDSWSQETVWLHRREAPW